MDKLVISPEARDYIIENGGAVTIRMVKGQGACCSMLSPTFELRRPSQPDDFLLISTDGIDLYLQNGLEVLPAGITIGLTKFLWIKRLDVHGLEILP